ncbi:MAG: methylated-DNA--[protein]-cysteine S-methyltransferase [Acidobacteriota bacterium]
MSTGARVIHYARTPSPFGPVLIAATDRGLCRLEISMSERVFVSSTKERYHSWVVRDEEFMAPYVRQLEEYFSGRRRSFSVQLDFLEGTDFQRKVWRALYRIPYGQVRSYKEVAQTIGSRHAFRAVGAGCGANPLAIIVPCHRVIGHDGRLVGFGYGLEMKQQLLQHEGALI